MQCPFCEAEKERLKVIDSRTCEGGKAIRRRRQCLQCSKRFTTYEKIEQNIRLSVVKKDGRRMPWDQKKVYVGLERACFKRPVSQSELQRIVDEVEEEIFKTYDREVPSGAVGTLTFGSRAFTSSSRRWKNWWPRRRRSWKRGIMKIRARGCCGWKRWRPRGMERGRARRRRMGMEAGKARTGSRRVAGEGRGGEWRAARRRSRRLSFHRRYNQVLVKSGACG
jgi:transcriptional repressor NrdR